MPRPAPATIATRPSNSPDMELLGDVQEDGRLAAAVAGHPGAGDVRREVAGKEHRDVADLVGTRHPSQRDGALDRRDPVVTAVVVLGVLGAAEAYVDGVDAHPG